MAQPVKPAGDQACIFSTLSGFSPKTGSRQKTGKPTQISCPLETIEYCAKYDRYDIYYQTLKTGRILFIQRTETLGDAYQDYWVENQLLWGTYYYDRGWTGRVHSKNTNK